MGCPAPRYSVGIGWRHQDKDWIGNRRMAQVIQASWIDFKRIVGSARERLLVCSAFYSQHGLQRLFEALPNGTQLTFVSRLSPSDWLNGVADPESLLELLERLHDDGRESRFIVHQRLHAKAYLADGSRGLVGSSNLSSGGFERNFEIMLDLDEKEAAATNRIIKVETDTHGIPLAPGSLRQWVDAHRSQVEDLRRDEPDNARLSDVQRSLDTLLGYGRAQVVDEHITHIEEYGTWLHNNQHLSGAEMLFSRLRNLRGQNLSGHVRQSYLAVVRFLHERPGYIERLNGELDSLRPTEIFEPDEELSADWIDHMDNHATDQGAGWDYAVLRSYLPPNLGGTRTGGGGASSTLKRMLPLVARFLRQRGGV